MAKIKNRYLSIISWALVCVLWNVIVLVIADLDKVTPNFWWAFAFIDVAFVVTGAIMGIAKLKGNNPIFSINVPYYLVSMIYFAVSLVLNFIFLLLRPENPEGSVTTCIILNAIVIVVYVVAMIVCYMGARHIDQNEQHIEAKVSELRTVEITVGALVYKTTDTVVKNKIEELKNKIHFSDPMGVAATADAEQDIKNQVQVISSLLSEGADQSTVVAAINDAIAKVEIRNQILVVSR